MKPGELSDAHIAQTYQELNKGLQQGYGRSAENELPNPRVIAMQRNLYKFSAAKDAQMLKEINSYLYDDNGNLLTFETFKAKLDSLNIKYNKNWLEAEYRTARQSGHNAQFWEDIQANKGLYPNLKYKTQEDDRVREEHEKMNNIIRPVDDAFWNDFYPPNGWRCRCFTVQTAEDPTSDENMPQITDKDVKPEFRLNVGKTGQIFKEDTQTGHRFFALAENNVNWPKRFELSKLEGGYNTVKTPKGNKVKVSIYAHEKDLDKNLELAIIANDNLNVGLKIKPHVGLTNYKNPEFTDIKGIKGDRVSPKWKTVRTAIDNAFKEKLSKKKKGQLAHEKESFVAIEVNFNPTQANKEAFIKQSWAKFKHYETINYVLFYKKNKIVKIDRKVLGIGFDFYVKIIESIINK